MKVIKKRLRVTLLLCKVPKSPYPMSFTTLNFFRISVSRFVLPTEEEPEEDCNKENRPAHYSSAGVEDATPGIVFITEDVSDTEEGISAVSIPDIAISPVETSPVSESGNLDDVENMLRCCENSIGKLNV